MKRPSRKPSAVFAATLAAVAMSQDVLADATYDALKSQVESLQKQLREVKDQLDAQEKDTTDKEVAELRNRVEQVSAQSEEWKNADSVVHLAGYGDFSYTDGDNQNGALSAVRFNPIFHYQYRDLIMLEAELELEVDETGGTTNNLEYLTVDLFVNDNLALLGGRFLSPIGQFRQNFHPSWINKLPTAPPGFGHDQAAPVSETGLQARGGFPLGGESRFINYALYAGNGPILEIVGNEIEAIEAEGRTSNDDDEAVFGGRIGILPLPRLELGLSGATGKVAGEDEPDATRSYRVFGADLAYQWRSLRLRGEYIEQKVGSEASSAAPDSAKWQAWYTQASYRFAPTGWEGVVRYGDYDSPHDSSDQKQWAVGVNYLFAANAMAKLAYNFNDGANGSAADDDGFQVQFAYGF